MIVRTWNLFHGNTSPPGRRAYLRKMVELITADRPDIVCLQEVPAWALPLIGQWAGMSSVWVQARRPRLGPLPIPAGAGRGLTSPHHGITRSGFAGQGNVILFPREATIREDKSITLNTNPFCEERGRAFGLTPKQMVRWEKERRVLHLVQYELPDRRRFLAANVHASHLPDTRLADAELRRGLNFVIRCSELEESAHRRGRLQRHRRGVLGRPGARQRAPGVALAASGARDRPVPVPPGDRDVGRAPGPTSAGR